MVLSVIIRTINVAILVPLYLNTTPILGLNILSVLFIRFPIINSDSVFTRMIILRSLHLFALGSAMKIDVIRSSCISTLSYILLIMPVFFFKFSNHLWLSASLLQFQFAVYLFKFISGFYISGSSIFLFLASFPLLLWKYPQMFPFHICNIFLSLFSTSPHLI